MPYPLPERDELAALDQADGRRGRQSADHPLPVFGRVGSLSVRLAASAEEVAAAQRIRYQVFSQEFGAFAGDVGRLDTDRFDGICDHLLVFDDALDGQVRERIVGTYRLLRQETAEANGGFYSAGMFRLDEMLARHPAARFLELGRSCVLPEYRARRTIDALWLGISAYVRRYGVEVLTGCASFPGTDPARHAQSLSFLARDRIAQGAWAVRPWPHLRTEMAILPPDSVDDRAALAAMPPLIKGYLRVGARFGDGCVVDRELGTVVVLVVLPLSGVADRYRNHYLRDGRPD